MKCANCGKQVPDKATACGYCGTKVEDMRSQTCPECGKQSPFTAKVCGYCGTRFGLKPAKAESAPVKEKLWQKQH